LYFDETKTGKRPAVLVFPEAYGLSAHAKEKAQRLAELGYVTLASDLYGEGKTPAPWTRRWRLSARC
jgi:dienelactone hydrolase